MAPRFRVTYATLSADNDDLHTAYEQGLQTARSWFGSTLPVSVDGESRTTGETFEVRSPVDTSIVLCRVHSATPADVADAVAAARRAAGSWAATPWQERVTLLRRRSRPDQRAVERAGRADEHGGRQEPAGGPRRRRGVGRPDPLLLHPAGEPRRLLRRDGHIAEHETTRSVLRPYGVWGVISPFNFPMALAAGPAGGALAAGNTVVLKPSPQGSFSASQALRMLA